MLSCKRIWSNGYTNANHEKEKNMIINNCEEFGQFIQKRRKELGYTQGYVAEVSGLSASFISNLENGKATAELGKAILLANLLGIDISVEKR